MHKWVVLFKKLKGLWGIAGHLRRLDVEVQFLKKLKGE